MRGKRRDSHVGRAGRETGPARLALLVASVAVLAAVAAPPAAGLNLTTYGYNNARSGSTNGSVGINAGNASSLRTVWVRNLPGAIDDEPLVVNHVKVGRRHRNLVLVGTGHGVVAAMDAGSGKLIWKDRLGYGSISPSCQASPDGVFGITGTMVADTKLGRVYAADEHGYAWALSLSSGRKIPGWPVRVNPSRYRADFIWGAMALSHGYLYVPVASLCDVGDYQGGLRAINVAHPHHILSFSTEQGTRGYGGGIWGWGGLSIDSATGDVFAATGNALGPVPENAGRAERVIRLGSTLHVRQSNYPLRQPIGISDRDFGTVPVLIHARGCPEQALAINKDGKFYVYDADRISHGPVQAIAVARSTSTTIPLYGMPAYDPHTRRLVLVSPTTPGNGLRAGIQTFTLSRGCRFHLTWQRGFDRPDAGGPPIIADGVIYIGSGRNGYLRVYRLSDGHELWGHSRGSAIFAAPAVADRTVFIGTWAGQLWAMRARR